MEGQDAKPVAYVTGSKSRTSPFHLLDSEAQDTNPAASAAGFTAKAQPSLVDDNKFQELSRNNDAIRQVLEHLEWEEDMLPRICPDNLKGGKCKVNRCDKIHLCPGFNSLIKSCTGTVCPMGLPHIRATCGFIRRQEPCMKGVECKWGHSFPALRLRIDQIRSSQGQQRGIISTMDHLKAIERGSAHLRKHANRREARRQQRRRK